MLRIAATAEVEKDRIAKSRRRAFDDLARILERNEDRLIAPSQRVAKPDHQAVVLPLREPFDVESVLLLGGYSGGPVQLQ
jgi:hypothetical protein